MAGYSIKWPTKMGSLKDRKENIMDINEFSDLFSCPAAAAAS